MRPALPPLQTRANQQAQIIRQHSNRSSALHRRRTPNGERPSSVKHGFSWRIRGLHGVGLENNMHPVAIFRVGGFTDYFYPPHLGSASWSRDFDRNRQRPRISRAANDEHPNELELLGI